MWCGGGGGGGGQYKVLKHCTDSESLCYSKITIKTNRGILYTCLVQHQIVTVIEVRLSLDFFFGQSKLEQTKKFIDTKD